ncbi:MAG TPA: tRNA (guanosine(37)-N1)-methyltransferase TrmD [Deinococcales bacterium]|nr:tRNA (guanosine(37)-N1)-methyltransferase TrmD [Deinococcales bacterium]
MKYTVYTLFPELISAWRSEALLGRALQQGAVELDVRDLRSFAEPPHYKVDDAPYGGGAGMVIRIDIAEQALAEVRSATPPPDEVILLSPAGEPFTQELAHELSRKQHLCLLCGRYEGFDARLEERVTREVSIGDYVLMGGELPALVLMEATARLLPGVIGKTESHEQDSFSTGLLDHPSYTRPEVFDGAAVPGVLLSGHHARVEEWRRKQALTRTFLRRPDLLEKAELSEADREFLASLEDH